VAAGPGSGKTRVLVHKVASLLTLEDVRTEQFLMLTYSRAVELIKSGQAAHKVENKSVLVIDEFQDIGKDEFELVRAIIEAAREIRVITVGDDDQNIFEVRGSSVQYMKNFKETFKATIYHLNTNFRSKNNLVQFSNRFIKRLPNRLKAGRIGWCCRVLNYRKRQMVLGALRAGVKHLTATNSRQGCLK
jgi:ATP-dependent DNA helicase RecQ